MLRKELIYLEGKHIKQKMKKTLIFISSNSALPKLREITRNVEQKIVSVVGPEVVIENIPTDLKNISPFRTFEEYEALKHNCKVCAEEALRLIKEWGDLKISEKSSFEDLSRYKSICLWRIYDYALLLYYFTDMVYYIKIISSIIEEESPDQVILVGSKFNSTEEIFFEIARQRGIPVRREAVYKAIRVFLPIFPIALERSLYLRGMEIRMILVMRFDTPRISRMNFINAEITLNNIKPAVA